MPRKSDNIAINNKEFDRRVKLSDNDKMNIKLEYKTGLISINGLARKYNVSKRTIQFTLFPERKEKAQQQFNERQKDGRYYDKKKNAEYKKKHRDYKKELYKQGKIGKDNSE